MSTSYAWADHRLFGAPEGAVLYGVDDASLFGIDEDTRGVLARWRRHDPLVLDRVPEPDRSTLEALRDARILMPSADRIPRVRTPVDPAEVPLGTLVLEVSQACNLACTYCYADGGSYGGEPRLLDPALARRAARYLVDQSGDREEVTLVLFGGEPLLNLPAVRAAVETAYEYATRKGKRVTFSLTTNGTRLTPEVIGFLREHKVSVAVSLDGPSDLHDANRPSKDGHGTYDQVIRNVRPLLDDPGAPVAARVTLQPSQWPRIPEVFDHLVGLGFHEVGIAPASPITPDLLPSDEEEQALWEGFAHLGRRFVEAAARGRVLPFTNVIDLVARLHRGTARTTPCGAGFGYLAADSLGHLYLCHRLAGEEGFQVGSLEEGFRADKVRGCVDALAEPRTEACGTCWARSLCAGGCHYENYLRETLLGLPPGGNCRFIRRWLQSGIELYARMLAQGSATLLARLASRAPC